jgi:hypothetical protein
MVEGGGRSRELLVPDLLAMGGATVVADYPKHVFAIFFVRRERVELFGHLGGGRIRNPRHDGGECAANRAAGIAVVGDARGHEQAADIGVAEA